MCIHCNRSYPWDEEFPDGEKYQSYLYETEDKKWCIATITPSYDIEYSCSIEHCPKCGQKLSEIGRS